MAEKVKVKSHYTCFRVTKSTHTIVTDHCQSKGLVLGTFYDNAALEKVKRDAEPAYVESPVNNRQI